MVTDVTAEGPDGLVLQRPVASVAGAGAQGKEDGSASRSQSLRVGDGGTAAEAEQETVGRRGPTGTQGQVSSEQPRGRGAPSGSSPLGSRSVLPPEQGPRNGGAGGSLCSAGTSSSEEEEEPSPAHHAGRTPSCRKERSGVRQLSGHEQGGTGLLGARSGT